MQGRPNAFQTGLFEAPCKAPGMCLASGCCPCCSACYWRKRSLETFGSGLADYECCQGYIPCPCCPFGMFRGTACGLCLEGCCCDPLSLSITRMYVMDAKNLHPDPADYQIIRCTNCLQIAACVCACAALISGNDACRDLSQCLNCVAELVMRTVEGCMGAQVGLELQDTEKEREKEAPVPVEVVTAQPYRPEFSSGGPATTVTDSDGVPAIHDDTGFNKNSHPKKQVMTERE